MSSASWELQRAVVARLASDEGLRAAMKVTGTTPATVLDHVPELQAMPYVEWEDGTDNESDATKGDVAGDNSTIGYGTEHTFRLYTWTDYEGRKQAKAMNDAIVRALRDAEGELELDGHHLINMRVQMSYTLRDPEGQAYYGVVGVRAVTEEA